MSRYIGDVETTNASAFDDGKGKFFVMSSKTRRTFCSSEGEARKHADNLIEKGEDEEMLVVRVVGRVRKKKTPTEYKRV